KRGRTRRTVVVDVGDRDAGHAELVERPVARRRVARDVADEPLLDFGVIDPGVLQGVGAGFACHVRVVPTLSAPGLLELRHSDSDYENLVRHFTVPSLHRAVV